LRSREAIIASGAYDPPKYRPIKDFSNRDQEKNRLASIFAFGEDLTKKKIQDGEKSPSPKLSRFDELFNELQDRQSFLEEMRSLGKSSAYDSQIQSEISQIIKEMELIDKCESEKLLYIQTKPSK
uniref:Rbsn domain-containing protein n=1 Tax=Rodentolepis nana TaxID=102285 RepID=A0A0R3TKU6_RODNA